MRMFDHSPWGGVSVTRAPEPVNQNLCPHVYGSEPLSVRIELIEPVSSESTRATAFECTMCGAYLVLHDRAG